MKYKYNNEWKELNVKVSDTYPIGAIAPYGGGTAPTNWLICDGSAVSRVTYAVLFSVIGTSFGSGDGSTTFNLPDLRSRVPLGKDSRDTDFDSIGETYGEKEHTLTVDEMPQHQHDMPYAPAADGAGTGYPFSLASGSATNSTSGQGRTNNIGTFNKGGSQAHNIVQPSLVTNYIIKAFQSAGVVGNVANTKSTSDKDTYSCAYLNKNIMTLSLTSSQTYTSTEAYQIKLLPLTLYNSVGNKLIYDDNEIKIGEGISKIKVNAHLVGTNLTANQAYGLMLYKNGNQIARSLVHSTDSYYKEFDISGILCNVSENDTLALYVYINQANNTIEANGDASFITTYMTVEVVE